MMLSLEMCLALKAAGFPQDEQWDCDIQNGYCSSWDDTNDISLMSYDYRCERGMFPLVAVCPNSDELIVEILKIGRDIEIYDGITEEYPYTHYWIASAYSRISDKTQWKLEGLGDSLVESLKELYLIIVKEKTKMKKFIFPEVYCYYGKCFHNVEIMAENMDEAEQLLYAHPERFAITGLEMMDGGTPYEVEFFDDIEFVIAEDEISII